MMLKYVWPAIAIPKINCSMNVNKSARLALKKMRNVGYRRAVFRTGWSIQFGKR